ncbi:cell wall-binding repeat-containing protein [Egibacter rhizosphaerae]|uniref:Cell wall-binding repeat-containing protein n=1 Tax=Egibacter rhizosphaerae TaxID=1670831 RepID=A0A411YDI2_9ACTN|nr:cell wall-binding repeat-containing protein [Egibacter rhizosphaerae]QBI19289.1 cell wall-binding repeat-containing protein [Egibacter rhizosphaerae]
MTTAGSAAETAAQDTDEDDAPTTDRLEGADRYATAAQLALASHEDAQTAILASGEDFPDALVASYGPAGVDAPILLSRHDTVPDVTLDALDDLGVESVFLAGGEAALSDGVLDEVQQDHDAFRIDGATRYETATLMLEGFDPPEVGTLDGDRTALLTSGEDFADALAAGPVAGSADLPLLLTTPQRSAVTEATADAMEGTRHDVDIERVIIVGGSEAVGEDVEAYLADERGFEVERWRGVGVEPLTGAPVPHPRDT